MATKNKYTYEEYKDNQETLGALAKKEEIQSQKPGDFQYNDYKESSAVTDYYNQWQQNSANKPGDYVSKWESTLNDILNGYMNRDKFSYDLNGDALYQQYKDQYVTQGKQAMMDTMGQASAMTGGYGNSYAQTVGQQTYQGYLQQLNDRVPELYKLALDKYNTEGEEMLNKYGLVSDRDNADYGRYRDTVSDWRADDERLANLYNNERNWDYNLYNEAYNKAWNEHRAGVSDWQTALEMANNEYWNQKNFGYGQYSDNRNLDYTDYRNGIADDQWQKNYDLEEAALDFQKAQASAAAKANATSGKKDDGSAWDNGACTTSEIKQMQAELGVAADGKWGKESTNATGGLSADEAYTAWKNGTLLESKDKAIKARYASWGAGEWEGYFAQIRNSEGQAAAEEELHEFSSKGYLPQNMMVYAAIGARGKLGH